MVNSDVLYAIRPELGQLSADLASLFRDAAAAGAIVVIPRTTLLEYERRQTEALRREVEELRAAATRLRARGIPVPEFEPEGIVAARPLPDLIRATGVSVEVLEPTLDDYRGAEHRACMHLPPRPPDIKSDEMRDLVIWEVALRTARSYGGAVLFSRDIVHCGDLGTDEAKSVRLHRAKDVDAVRELLGKEDPIAVNARLLLTAIAPSLRRHEFPLPNEIKFSRVEVAGFSLDEAGHLSGSFSFEARTDAGPLSANISISQVDASHIAVALTDVRYQNNQWRNGSLSYAVDGALPVIDPPDAEALTDLRDAIGEGT